MKIAGSRPFALIVRPIALAFFYMPTPAAAASSDVSLSSYDFALVAPESTARVSQILWPVGLAAEVSLLMTSVMWLPSESRVAPILFPFGAVLTPVVNIPSRTSMVMPIVIHFLKLYTMTSVSLIS